MIDFSLNPFVVETPKKSVTSFSESPISDWMDNFDDNPLQATTKLSRDAAAMTDNIDDKLSDHVIDNRSIVARSKNSVCQFPCYVTQSCPITPAQTVAKLFERVYATLVQTAVAQHPFIDEDEANDMAFLKNFHTNLKESTEEFLKGYERLVNEFYEPIDELDRMMCESIYCEHVISKNCKVMFRVVPTTNPDLIAECARLANEPLAGFAYLQEADVTTDVTTTGEVMSDDDINNMAKERIRNEYRAELIRTYQPMVDNEKDPEKKKAAAAAAQRAIDSKYDADIQDLLNNEERVNHTADEIRRDIQQNKLTGYTFDGHSYRRNRGTYRTSTKVSGYTDAVDPPKMLRDADIKKMNAMLPYTIEATFRIRGQGGSTRDVKYIIGIKTILHVIRVQDLAEDLRDIVMGNVRSLQKVRYKTGEIGLVDYLFNPKQLKADAMKRTNGNKRWLSTLKRLGEYDQLYGTYLRGPMQRLASGDMLSSLKGNIPRPNATMILTQPDITSLTDQTGIDLSKIENANRLAKSLFLVAFCIIDASAGTMRVLFTGDNDWDVQSLAAIDAEVSKTDNSQIMRELNHIVNR